jgi:hypothetical protein
MKMGKSLKSMSQTPPLLKNIIARNGAKMTTQKKSGTKSGVKFTEMTKKKSGATNGKLI